MRHASLSLCLLLYLATAVGQSRDSAPQVSIRKLKIECSSCQLSAQERSQISEEVKSHTKTSDEISQQVRSAYQKRGFFKVVVSEPSVTPIGPADAHGEIDAAISVKEGQQYHLKAITFSGGTAFSAAELRPEFRIADGDLFNVDQIRQGLEALRELYASKGFVKFAAVPDTTVDDEKRTVAVRIDLHEGDRTTAVN